MLNNYEIQKAVRAAKLIPKVKPVIDVEPHIAVMPMSVAEATPITYREPKAIDE